MKVNATVCLLIGVFVLTQSANAADVETVINDKNRVCEGSDRGLDNKETRLLKRAIRNGQRDSKTHRFSKQDYSTIAALYTRYREQIRKLQSLYKKLSPPDLVAPHYGTGGADVIAWNRCDMDTWKNFSNLREQVQQNRSEMKHFLTAPSITAIDKYLGVSSDRLNIFDLQAPIGIGAGYYR